MYLALSELPPDGPLLVVLVAGAALGACWRAVLRLAFGTVLALALLGVLWILSG
ncbi:hypothetical protein [Pseudonocardia pini]|uniref:hypothetical protein n=1 Tax=Pseudonocardia pini TaxID=2758030 RepID=UPI001FE859C8|nr:hypothetical protein [Pseudonocardia pini]